MSSIPGYSLSQSNISNKNLIKSLNDKDIKQIKKKKNQIEVAREKLIEWIYECIKNIKS